MTLASLRGEAGHIVPPALRFVEHPLSLRLRLRSWLLAGGSARRNCGHTKAHEGAFVLRPGSPPDRRPAESGVEVPAAAPERGLTLRADWVSLRRLRVVSRSIKTPLPDAAVHVE